MSICQLSIELRITLCLCSALIAGTLVSAESKQVSEVPWDVLDGGGGVMCSENYSVGGSLGQIAPGVCTTTTRIVSAGYWAGIDSLSPCEEPGLCGDANNDGRVTIADATYVVAFIYRGGPAPVNNSDVNVDGRITIADATYIVAYIYRGGPDPCNPSITAPVRTQRRAIER